MTTTHQDRPGYPVPDYVPMAATALTDAQRWPLLTDAGAANLRRLREHPNAPHYNHACGDRLTEAARERLRGYRAELAAGSGWTAAADPPWLAELIDRVYRTVPRYRARPRPAALTDVPTTGRHDLLAHVERHVPDDADLDDLIVFRTSGSRGPAATVPMSPEFCALDLPVIEHVLTGLGVRLSGGPDRVALVNVYHQPRAYQFASVSSYLDDAGVLKINLDAAGWRDPGDPVAFLDDCAAEVYTGNPVSLAALADLDLRTAPKAILSGAMALGDGLRELLRSRFGCPVVDLYGITEAGLIAWRTDGDVHRLLPRRLLVEILDADGNRCPDGVSGEITVTCGENAALPLLRYRTGDHAALDWRDGVPVLVGFEGREPIRFRAAAGTWVQSIELTHVLSPLGFAAWRLHQAADGSVALTLHATGGSTDTAARDAVRGLLGELPITVTTADLAGDAKPQRYSCDVAGAAVA